MRKTRVVILHNILNPHVIPLFEKLAKEKGYNFKFFFASESENNRLWKEEVGDKFDYKILPKIAIELKGKDLFTYFINPTIIFELIKYNPDVVIVGGWDLFAYQVAFFYAKLFCKKFILRSGSTKYEKSWRRSLAKPLVKLIVLVSDAFIAYGSRAREHLISLGAKPKKIFLAYNTIDVGFFQKEIKKWRSQKLRVKARVRVKTDNVILYVGQLIERKGVGYLIKAFAKLREEFKDVSLLIVGYGLLEGELRELVRKRRIPDVFFIIGRDWREMPIFYAIADLFVLPSLEEVWGLVINEAMVAGLPVITTDRAGASVDLIEEGRNGYIIESKNLQALYKAMKKIIENAELSIKMGKESKNSIRAFGLDNTTQGFLKAIKYVAK